MVIDPECQYSFLFRLQKMIRYKLIHDIMKEFNLINYKQPRHYEVTLEIIFELLQNKN